MKHLLVTTIAAVLLVGCGPKAPKGIVHIYAQEGDIVAVKQHLAAGTDVNAKDDYLGMTILQSAALGGQKEIVELLIAKGADVNAKGRKGHFTPLDTAFMGTDKETADLLRKHGGKTSKELNGIKESIQDAVKAANIEAVKEFLAEGADVNGYDLDGKRPLYIAASYGHKEIVELLIANGADVNVEDISFLDTPLNIAASYGHKEIAKILIAKGADVNAKDWEGNTPLDMAVSKEPRAEGKKEIANFLRKHGGKTAEELKGGEPVAEAARAPSKSSKSRSSSSKTSSRLSSGSRPTTGRSSGTTSSRSGSSPSRTSSSRSGSVSSLGGTRTTRAVPTRARRTYPKPPPMKGGDPAVQALEMMHQKDLAESKGVPMPPLPFQQQLEDAPPADAIRDDRPPMPPVPGGPIPPPRFPIPPGG